MSENLDRSSTLQKSDSLHPPSSSSREYGMEGDTIYFTWRNQDSDHFLYSSDNDFVAEVKHDKIWLQMITSCNKWSSNYWTENNIFRYHILLSITIFSRDISIVFSSDTILQTQNMRVIKTKTFITERQESLIFFVVIYTYSLDELRIKDLHIVNLTWWMMKNH